MSDRFTSPFLIDKNHNDRPLQRIDYGTPPFTEAQIQGLLRVHPELLAIDQIDSLFAPAVCIGREVRTESGLIDNLYVSPNGFLTIVETKLWRNPQSRREVVSQTLEYAKELSRWTLEQLDDTFNKFAKQFGVIERRSIAAYVAEATNETVDEQQFADSLARCLRGGTFLLLIVGEGIRESAEDLISHLSRTPGLGFNLSLIELSCYRIEEDKLLLIPRTVARTVEIERAIVTVEIADNSKKVRVTVDPPLASAAKGSRSTRTLSEDEFKRKLREALPSETIAIDLFRFLHELQQLGVHLDYKAANVSLRYDPKREDSETLSVLSLNKAASLWAGFWLEGQLDRSGISGSLAEKFWAQLADIDPRFAPCDKNDRAHFVPVSEIVGQLSNIVAAVEELLNAVDSSPSSKL